MSPKRSGKLGHYDVPVEVVELVEDLLKLDSMVTGLREIDPWNITISDTHEQREFGRDMLATQLALVRSWQRYARRRLRKYLAP